jgi:hypothetical protein
VNKTVGIVLVVGVLAIAAYFIISSTSASSSECSGDWTDYFNPACYAAAISDEFNTVLIIVAVAVVLIVGLLAFGPSTQHLAGAAALL